jgi:hypothetical protein
VRDPNPCDPVRDRERAEEHKQPFFVSHAKEDHRDAGANADRCDQDGDEAIADREVRKLRAGPPLPGWNNRSGSFMRPGGFGLMTMKRTSSLFFLDLSSRFGAIDCSKQSHILPDESKKVFP